VPREGPASRRTSGDVGPLGSRALPGETSGTAGRFRPSANGREAELLYGVDVSPRRAQDAAALAAFLSYVNALPFGDDGAVHYAGIRANLKAAPCHPRAALRDLCNE
jgi:hypothetical protein